MDRNKVQEALKPITDGLFGKQRPVRYERPHFKVRPLVRMLQDHSDRGYVCVCFFQRAAEWKV
mgnify:CR=1 FL=1